MLLRTARNIKKDHQMVKIIAIPYSCTSDFIVHPTDLLIRLKSVTTALKPVNICITILDGIRRSR